MKYLIENTQDRVASQSRLDDLFFSLSINLFPCNYFIEAGAFEAYASKKVKKKLPHCNVYAFEANPYNYRHFVKDIKDINYENIAISNKEGNIDFNIMLEKKGKKVDLIKMDNSISPRNKKGVVYKQVIVCCTSLDYYFRNQCVNECSLWIDVEGHGLECLQGANQILDNSNFIKIEVEDKQYWKNQALSTDIINLLANKNFIPVIRDYQSPLQYNILFARKDITKTEIFRKCYE